MFLQSQQSCQVLLAMRQFLDTNDLAIDVLIGVSPETPLIFTHNQDYINITTSRSVIQEIDTVCKLVFLTATNSYQRNLSAPLLLLFLATKSTSNASQAEKSDYCRVRSIYSSRVLAVKAIGSLSKILWPLLRFPFN